MNKKVYLIFQKKCKRHKQNAYRRTRRLEIITRGNESIARLFAESVGGVFRERK